jgi:flagellar hook-basal body complex protein FliE
METSYITRQLSTQTSNLLGESKVGNEGKKDITFQSVFNEVLNNTNSLIVESEELTEEVAIGKTDNIHQVLIAAEKADIALQLTLQIRNKVLDAYNEIMRMQI